MNPNLKTPEISVILPVYNGEKYLRDAIDSILNQTFMDFELIIIDDGSRDDSASIIKSYQDKRIILIQQRNKGLSAALNVGISKSSGKYIARMDADDISLPQRLEKQISFLEKHPDIGIVGTWAIMMTEEGEDIYIADIPQNDLGARELLAKSSPFFHGSVMFRRSIFDSCGPYPEEIGLQVEDWVLWHQFATRTKLANIGRPLFKHRIRPNAITSNRTKNDRHKLSAIVYRYLKDNSVSAEDLSFIQSLQTEKYKKRSEANYFFKCGRLFLHERKDHSKARRMIRKGLSLDPNNARGIVDLFFTFLTPEMVTFCKSYWKQFKLFIKKV